MPGKSPDMNLRIFTRRIELLLPVASHRGKRRPPFLSVLYGSIKHPVRHLTY
jgi:hypothetical protein